MANLSLFCLNPPPSTTSNLSLCYVKQQVYTCTMSSVLLQAIPATMTQLATTSRCYCTTIISTTLMLLNTAAAFPVLPMSLILPSPTLCQSSHALPMSRLQQPYGSSTYHCLTTVFLETHLMLLLQYVYWPSRYALIISGKLFHLMA